MGLESAMYTGLSGLSVNQQQLTVVSNNIANANTTAFKSSRVLFTTEAYITQDPGSPATSNFGGSNPSQIGLGATVGSVQKDFVDGQIQNTGNPYDMAISGDGFFVVKGQNGQEYTRNGAFGLNSNDQLVTSDGSFVQGYGVDSNFNIVPNTLQNLTIPLNNLTTAQQTANATFAGQLNTGGAIANGASIIDTQDLTTSGGATTPTSATLLTNVTSASANLTPLFSTGDVLTLNGKVGPSGTPISPPLTFAVTASSTVQDLQDFFNQGLQIDTSVTPPAGAPTPGVSLIAGTAANSIDLSITGNTGAENALTLDPNSLTSTNAGNASPLSFTDDPASNPVGEGVTSTGNAFYDSLGNKINVNITTTYAGPSPTGGTTWQFVATSPDASGAGTFTPGSPTSGAILGQGTLTFDSSGNFVSATTPTLTIDRTGSGALSPMQVKLDFSGMMASSSGNPSSMTVSQDGVGVGYLQSFSVGTDGVISGNFNNGVKRPLGQLAVATFSNEQGLVSEANNMYSSGGDSGTPTIGPAGAPGVGTIAANSLEQSNVDLSTEFVNLIIASTGFSAASRVITTSDQLVQDLLNSTR